MLLKTALPATLTILQSLLLQPVTTTTPAHTNTGTLLVPEMAPNTGWSGQSRVVGTTAYQEDLVNYRRVETCLKVPSRKFL